MMQEMIQALCAIQCNGVAPKVLVDCGPDKAMYDEKRQVFNRKFQFKPTAIVLCSSTEHVAEVVKITAQYEWPLRVRSGGHDHEGECSATDVVVIDFCTMNYVEVDTVNQVARIQPGIVFQDLIPILNSHKVGIPHGTCGTVAVAGFTFGGGWGPWTRRHGMCCESLIGATIVLGDGSIAEVTEDNAYKELLWALRGGGGMSYGIVTELVIRTFPLPENTVKFNVVWNDTPAIKVLELWENLIAPGNTYQLLGTNLKIMAKPLDDQPVEESIHTCVFYGYYDGSIGQLKIDVNNWFNDLPPSQINIPKDKEANEMMTFSSWDRISTVATKRNLLGNNPLKLIPPDLDDPGPHKITSRLVVKEGLGDEGRKTLIRSLESDLIFPEDNDAALYCYVTLGAIWGSYYQQYQPQEFPAGSAFPYKDRPYTIQYQVWWDEGETDIQKGKEHHVYRYTNRAEDWIEQCRSREFPQTDGSFISFKDSSVPTSQYFLQSYDQLKAIKDKYSKDPDNRFRSRKTII
jgi:hypothetical protein